LYSELNNSCSQVVIAQSTAQYLPRLVCTFSQRRCTITHHVYHTHPFQQPQDLKASDPSLPKSPKHLSAKQASADIPRLLPASQRIADRIPSSQNWSRITTMAIVRTCLSPNTLGSVSDQSSTMYSETHFHSTTHEVLAIFSGSAKCCFGGEENPGRVEPVLSEGDVVVVPAGVGHRLLEDYGGFQMVGSYPKGHDWDVSHAFRVAGNLNGVVDSHSVACSIILLSAADTHLGQMCYGRENEESKIEGIQKLKWFERDPIYGDQGPVHDA
jgi:uncharacterized protein YjlB